MQVLDLAVDRLEQINHVAATPALKDRLNEATVGVILGGLGSGLQLPALLSAKGLPPAKGRELADTILANGRATLRNLTDALLISTSDITPWHQEMVEAVLPIHVGAAVAIAGTMHPPGPWAEVLAAALLGQVDYLDGFAADVASGAVAPGPGAAARAALYAWSAWGTAQRAWRAVQIRLNDEERRVLGEVKTHHCRDCRAISFERTGWVPVGTLPEIGDSRCEMFCHCHFEYRRRQRARPPNTRAGATPPPGFPLPAAPPVLTSPPTEPIPPPATKPTLGLKFTPTEAAVDNGRVTVLVDVRKLDEGWKLDGDKYLPPGGGADKNKYNNAELFIGRARAQGIVVEQSHVTVDKEGVVSFIDGRHRFAVLRDSGAMSVPVSVEAPAAARLRKFFGAGK
jgi:hypothetical protein